MFIYQENSLLQLEKTISIYELIQNGGIGGMLIIGLLFVLLIVVIFIYFERLFAIKAASKIDNAFMPEIRTHIIGGKIATAKSLN